jgi:hypothetical protein
MEPEILKSRVVTLTDEHGESTTLPFDVLEPNEQRAAEFLACFAVIAPNGQNGDPETDAVKVLSKFQESPWPLASVEVSDKTVWCGRMSAPGYLDCSPWEWAGSKRELLRSLRG